MKKQELRIHQACVLTPILLVIIMIVMVAGCNESANGQYEAEQACLGYTSTEEDAVRIVQVTDYERPRDVAKTIEWMNADGFIFTKEYQVCTYNMGGFETYLVFERE